MDVCQSTAMCPPCVGKTNIRSNSLLYLSGIEWLQASLTIRQLLIEIQTGTAFFV